MNNINSLVANDFRAAAIVSSFITMARGGSSTSLIANGIFFGLTFVSLAHLFDRSIVHHVVAGAALGAVYGLFFVRMGIPCDLGAMYLSVFPTMIIYGGFRIIQLAERHQQLAAINR